MPYTCRGVGFCERRVRTDAIRDLGCFGVSVSADYNDRHLLRPALRRTRPINSNPSIAGKCRSVTSAETYSTIRASLTNSSGQSHSTVKKHPPQHSVCCYSSSITLVTWRALKQGSQGMLQGGGGSTAKWRPYRDSRENACYYKCPQCGVHVRRGLYLHGCFPRS